MKKEKRTREKDQEKKEKRQLIEELRENEYEFLYHDDDFIGGTYSRGLVKGTRRIETSEVRPDKGM